MSHSAFHCEVVIETPKKSRFIVADIWSPPSTSTFTSTRDLVVVGTSEGSIHVYETEETPQGINQPIEHAWKQIYVDENFGRGKLIEQLIIIPTSIAFSTSSTSSTATVTNAAQGDLLCVIIDSILRIYQIQSTGPDSSRTVTIRPIYIHERSKGCYLIAINRGQIPMGQADTATTTSTSSSTSRRTSIDSKSSPAINASPYQRLCFAIAMKTKKIGIYQWVRQQTTSPYELSYLTELALMEPLRTLDWCDTSLLIGTRKEYILMSVNSQASLEICQVGKKQTTVSCLLPDREIILVQDYLGICFTYDGKPSRQDPIQWNDVPIAISYHHPYLIAILANDTIECRNQQTGTLVQSFIGRGARTLTKRGNSIFAIAPSSIRHLASIGLYAQVDELLAKQQFSESISLIQQSRPSQWLTGGATERLAKLDEVYIHNAYHLFNIGDYQQAMIYFQQAHNIDPVQILSLFPDVLPSGQSAYHQIKHPVKVNRAQGEDNLLSALSALIPYLAQIQNRLRLTTPAMSSPSNTSTLSSSFTPSSTSPSTNTTRSSTGEMSLASLVDTVLLKAYLLTDIPLMPFLQQPNQCDIEECQNILRAYEKYAELVCLYKSRGYHREALELLSHLGQATHHPNNPLVGTSYTVNYLQELAVMPHLPQETIRLILEFSRWVLAQDPEEGLRIFTYAHTHPPDIEHGNNVVIGVPPSTVLEHLKKYSDSDLVMAYLESLISTGETTPLFHNELVYLYLETITKLARLQPQSQQNGQPHTRVVAGSEPGRLGILRLKLLDFLRRSLWYNPEKMLSKFPRNELLEERAILLSRIQQHQQALAIYAHALGDIAMAEEYCARYYNPSVPDERDIYLHLLKVYLSPNTYYSSNDPSTSTPSDSHPPLISAALSLLTRHPDKIDSAAAVALLPGTIPLNDLMPYFQQVLAQNSHIRRHNQVVCQLLRAEHLSVREASLRAGRDRILIDQDTICPRCAKKMGNSAFARYPNGQILHYICYTMAQQQ